MILGKEWPDMTARGFFLQYTNRLQFHFWSIFCGQKVNFKWRSYQADRPLVFFIFWLFVGHFGGKKPGYALCSCREQAIKYDHGQTLNGCQLSTQYVADS